MKRLILLFISIINKYYPKNENKAIFLSSPDMSDNSFAFFKYLIENYPEKYIFIWLFDDMSNLSQYRSMIINNINISDEVYKTIKFFSRNSIKAFYYYVNSKYIFFTHGFYARMSLPKSQIRINLWHGMPLKTIGALDTSNETNDIQKSTYLIATSKRFQKVMSDAFLVNPDRVLITGQPRCDLLLEKSDCLRRLGIEKEKYRKIIFWAPTYRNTEDNRIKDGAFQNYLPLLGEGELEKLNQYLSSIDSYMVIKLHPMDILNKHHFEMYSNIQIIKKMDLLEKSCQLYSLLSEVDILLTDFSSIYIDFLLLNRPIIFVIDDFDAYEKTRNFVFSEPKRYMPGEIVENYTGLINVLDDLIVREKDRHVDNRYKVKKEFHHYGCNFSKRVIERLQL